MPMPFATEAEGGPSPNTVWVASFHNGQARHASACSRNTRRLVDILSLPFSPFGVVIDFVGRRYKSNC
jgi:hypothetical protein